MTSIVLRRRVDLLAVRSGQLDLVEALTLDPEAAGQRSVALRRQRRRCAVVQQNPSARRRHRRRDAQRELRCPRMRGDIAAVIDLTRRRDPCRREAILEIELRRAVGRSTTASVNESLRDARRSTRRSSSVALSRWKSTPSNVLDRCPPPERAARARTRARRRAHQHRRVVRAEAEQLRADRLVGAARHLGFARRRPRCCTGWRPSALREMISSADRPRRR